MDTSNLSVVWPDIEPEDEQAVAEMLRSDRFGDQAVIEAFEDQVARRSGCGFGVATGSAPAALGAVLRGLKVGRGDEVIVSPLADPGMVAAVAATGATLAFVDVDPMSLTLDPNAVAAACGSSTRAVLFSHTLGNPEHIGRVCDFCNQRGLELIEDATDAIGTRVGDIPVGAFGRAAVFGFRVGRAVTTGEGGMVVTDDAQLSAACRAMRDRGGVVPASSAFVPSGMSTMQAALGASQVRRLGSITEQRATLATEYMRQLVGVRGLTMPTMGEATAPCWSGFAVRLDAEYGADERERVIAGLRNHEIWAAPGVGFAPDLPGWHGDGEAQQRALPIASLVSRRVIALPFSLRMTARDVDLVAQTLALMIQRLDLSRE